ncbi:MAG: Translation initiation factor IF-3 [Holosporales bacterium]
MFLFFRSSKISSQRMNTQDNKPQKNADGPRVNFEIVAPKVRVVGADGEMIGVLTRNEAIKLAQQSSLDLVEVSPNAEPPVCKIINYGKYKYELQKKKAEAKKKQKIIEVKEIQLRPMIGAHDLEIKSKAIARFIADGNKVKVVMRFRGREMAHQEIGLNIMNKIKESFDDVAKPESQPKLEGQQVIMILAPNKENKK